MTRHITRDDSTDAKLGPNPSRRLTCVVLATAMALIAAFTSNGWTGDGTRAGDDGFEVAILAGGCFWGMEGLLRNLDGVVDTEVGYASDGNDKKATPAEAIRQGNDRGAEYRSAIFVLDERQREIAREVRAEVDASGFWKNPLVTEINDAGKFKEAAEHHQDYLEKNPGGYTCHFVRAE